MKSRPTILLFSLLLGLLAGLGEGCKKAAPDVNLSAAMQSLKSAEPDAKANGCIELAKAGPAAAAATPDLIAILKDNDPLVRHLAAYALGQIGPKAAAALPALREALNDPDRQVVSDALNALRFIGDKDANVQVNNVMGPAPSP